MADPADKPLTRTVRDGIKPGIDAATENALRNEFLMKQQFHTHERSNPNVLDLGLEVGHSALYSGIQSPIISIAQIADKGMAKLSMDTKMAKTVALLPAPEEEKFGTARWHAQVIGGGAGMALPFFAARGGLKATGLTFAGRTETAMATSGRLLSLRNGAIVADGAAAGFVYDFLLTPVQEGEADFWGARRKHGLTGAATFGTLTAGSVALRAIAGPAAGELRGLKRLAVDVTGGAGAGIPAGIVNADVSARLTKDRWATGEERVQGAYTMAMAGGVLSAFHKVPGQDLSPGDKAVKTSADKAGVKNLNAMLAARAAEVMIADVTAGKPTIAPEGGTLGGTRKGAGSEASRMTTDKVKDGRALGSTDVEGKEFKAEVKPEQQPILQKAIDLGFQASDPAATPADVAKFINYARTEGADVFEALLKVAEQSGDAKLLTIAREAYLPLEGVEHRVIEGDAKINPEPGKPVTQDQLTRWEQFTKMVVDPPVDVEGYAKFRTELFQWLDKNPDLHSWVQQFSKQNNWSNLAGPLDFYFETNEMSRFMEVIKPREEKPTTMADIANMRTFADEFANQVYTTPYEANLVEGFRALAEKSVGLNVPQFAHIINEALAKKGLRTVCQVGIDSNWQMTLYIPKGSTKTLGVSQVDYTSVAAPEKINNLGAEDGLYASQAGRMASEQLGIQPDLRARLEQNLKSDLASDPRNLDTIQLNRAIQNAILHEQPLRPEFVKAYQNYTKTKSADHKAALQKEVETGIYTSESLGRATISKAANEFGKAMSLAKEQSQVEYIFAETALALRKQGVAIEDVPKELNHILRHNRMPYDVVLTPDGKLELNHVTKSESNAPIISVFFDAKGKVDVKTKFEPKAEPVEQPRKETKDRTSVGTYNYGDAGKLQGTVLEVARESRVIAQEFVEDLAGVSKGSEASKICQEALMKLKGLGVPASDVPGYLNRALRRTDLRFSVVFTPEGALELVFHHK